MEFCFSHRRYSAAFRTPIRTAQGLWADRTGVLVKLVDEKGQVGFGEAAPISWFGTETTEEIDEVCRGFGEKVTDEVLARVPPRMSCLRGALQAAKQSLAAAASEQNSAEPTTSSEGIAYLPVAALLPAGRLALEKIEPLGEIGFRTFKWKVGVEDLADELSILDDVISLLPKGGELRLDANGAWDRRRSERWLERCAERPIEFLEQPIASNLRGAEDLLLGLANDYPTPIALDESVALDGEIEHWLHLGWPGVFVVKPLLLGDALTSMERLRKAKARVVFSSALETAVGAQWALRLALNFDGAPRALGFGVTPLFRDPRLDGLALAPFIRREDVERLNPENVWNVLS